MQHFSNYFLQILVIRSKCQGGINGLGGQPPLYFSCICINILQDLD